MMINRCKSKRSDEVWKGLIGPFVKRNAYAAWISRIALCIQSDTFIYFKSFMGLIGRKISLYSV